MEPSTRSNPSWLGRWQQRALELADELCAWKMGCLTALARRHLPDGYWGGPGPGGARTLYLTFDDGPDPATTPWLLELLEAEQVPATFFLIGSAVARHEDLAFQISLAGQAVGNHSFNHFFMPALSTRMLEKEIDTTNLRIEQATGHRPAIFRPPFGVIDRRAADCLKDRQMQAVYWGAVPEDWSALGAHRVVKRVIKQVGDGTLIVMHESRWLARQTIAAAKEIILKGKEMGYQFKPVPGPPG